MITHNSKLQYHYRTLPLNKEGREKMKWIEMYERKAKRYGLGVYYWKTGTLDQIKLRVAKLEITIRNLQKECY